MAVGLIAAGTAWWTTSSAASETPPPSAPMPALRSKPVALFIGDSYVSGSGGVGHERSFACLAADAMGWECINQGQPGTGYANPGKRHSKTYDTYARRALRHSKSRLVDYVVVSGGRNDAAKPMAERIRAVRLTLDRLATSYPSATVVILGPFALDPNHPRGLQTFNRLARAEVERHDVLYADPLGERWLEREDAEDQGLMDNDGVHPNQLGHQRLANLLVAAMQRGGISPAEGRPDQG